ncbi:hypothetical protein [Belnapia rosea]|uniref:hypothetical protein n=1 Tax=Belnapia rosea TaxID=938405 RepID=UPI0008846AB8|nr:hypothetical protein [Belnapia rosea]SDB29132.1 hypothetical protein SAMN02927895_00978 [Belnapia rosea]
MTTPADACDWSIVLLSRGEVPRLARCLAAIRQAAEGRDARVTVLLRGGDAAEAARAVRSGAALPGLRLYALAQGDRANAWNQYVHALRPGAAMHAFVEDHALIGREALRSLAAALAADPAAEAATALPSQGRQVAALRARLRRGGRLHGTLHALSGRFVEAAAAGGFRLPVGLERIHPLLVRRLGDRITVAEEASWRAMPHGFQEAWHRRLRAARARMEEAALAGRDSLPEFALPMLRDWQARQAATGGFFDWLARRRLALEAIPTPEALRPRPVPV